ncbi:MAG: helix-turn-helix domain-containing protein [Bacteroidales bacterium]|jgi:DNA-binding XRE family transcriptional regulator|nr:helix-turn-helix domain-containing protein [Bacteroidales bacterium]MCI2122409.1 helix-turn-helix domain-containing protein [Bacteroidales bacterium]MCI2145051.1 helix-turn-helix domain-containing protein [Bacteroidales bacterium]
MMFINRIKQLREDSQMPQRQLAAALDIDTATYCKIEKGIRCVKRDQVITIAKILNADQDEFLSLWLADQILNIVKNEKELAEKALAIVKEKIKQ